ncbi:MULTISPECIES: cation diffusion facilitator family transporter [Glaesserella]|uniref:Cobalt transporter n=1 Tax=Glaesserella australis TaxID=2094024 RepID=A0A328C5Z2_9PAST|nr:MULTISPECIES: cation diffusion facilitator family transporter [Glaesserella]AUI66873.1 cobalt transporter [Glaesserella sp. 15-184]RAL19924.1 cobalt transporter [Glaesserella australis]
MACSTCSSTQTAHFSHQYRKALWIAFGLNLTMFAVEIIMGIKAGSVSLLSDSLDFFGDSANYLISLIVLPMALSYRAKASLLKGATMGGFGIFILFTTLYNWFYGEIPNHSEMSVVGVLALLTNLTALWVLYRFREGDSNIRGVWLCSRNDAIGNVAVILAGVAVYFTQSKYPDLIVAFVLSFLAIQAAKEIISQAWQELR